MTMTLSFVMGTTQKPAAALNGASNPLGCKFLMGPGRAPTAMGSTHLHQHHVVQMQTTVPTLTTDGIRGCSLLGGALCGPLWRCVGVGSCTAAKKGVGQWASPPLRRGALLFPSIQGAGGWEEAYTTTDV